MVIILIAGQKASGKSTFCRSFLKKYLFFTQIKSFTNRPKATRDAAFDDHVFTGNEFFKQPIKTTLGYMMDGYHYEFLDFDPAKMDVVLITANSLFLETLKSRYSNVFAILIKADAKIIQKRLQERGTRAYKSLEAIKNQGKMFYDSDYDMIVGCNQYEIK